MHTNFLSLVCPPPSPNNNTRQWALKFKVLCCKIYTKHSPNSSQQQNTCELFVPCRCSCCWCISGFCRHYSRFLQFCIVSGLDMNNVRIQSRPICDLLCIQMHRPWDNRSNHRRWSCSCCEANKIFFRSEMSFPWKIAWNLLGKFAAIVLFFSCFIETNNLRQWLCGQAR